MVSGVHQVRRIRGHLTNTNGISAMIKTGINQKWFQKGYFLFFNDKLTYFSRGKLKILSQTCKTGSITVLKIRFAGYKYRPFHGIKSVSRLALRQQRRRRGLRTCLCELWGVLSHSSTLFVFLVTLLNFFREKLESNSSFSNLSLSLWVYWGSRWIH